MGGGAWPFLVGGVICLVDSDNERDPGSKIVLLFSRMVYASLEDNSGLLRGSTGQ